MRREAVTRYKRSGYKRSGYIREEGIREEVTKEVDIREARGYVTWPSCEIHVIVEAAEVKQPFQPGLVIQHRVRGWVRESCFSALGKGFDGEELIVEVVAIVVFVPVTCVHDREQVWVDVGKARPVHRNTCSEGSSRSTHAFRCSEILWNDIWEKAKKDTHNYKKQ